METKLTNEPRDERKKRILVVDDEHDLCDILLFNLTSAGYQVEAAYSAQSALTKIAGATEGFDLLLLDVMMPEMSGFELARRVKSDGCTAHTPIIFLTAKDGIEDTLQGFSLGADDYVTKPFSVREVIARVRAVLNRTGKHPMKTPATMEYEGLVVDLMQKCVTVDGEKVVLSKTEFELLAVFLSHRGQVLSRQQLLQTVWPDDVIVSDRTVDVTITRLRKKIGQYANNIVARHGYGYVFVK